MFRLPVVETQLNSYFVGLEKACGVCWTLPSIIKHQANLRPGHEGMYLRKNAHPVRHVLLCVFLTIDPDK